MRTSVAILVALGVCPVASGLVVRAQWPSIRVGRQRMERARTVYPVQFKYFSQNTIDRPGVEHLGKVVEWVNASARRAEK